MRPVNPYNIYPVYPIDTPLSLLGYYSVPTTRTPALQFSRIGTSTVAAFDLVTTAGAVLSQDTSEVSTFTTDGGITFYTTDGNALLNPPQNGTMYRPRITLTGGAIFWGHKCCASAVFDTTYPSLRVSACTNPNFTLDPTFPFGANVQILVEDNNSAYSAQLDPSSAILDVTVLTVSGGSYSATITITANVFNPNGGTRRVSTAYPFSVPSADPCSAIDPLGAGVESGLEDSDAFELSVFNSTDIQSQGIYYGGGFRQKLWFSGQFGQPQPQVTENYLENGEGELFFQSARTGEAQVLEFWPCPDRAAITLPFVKYNSSIILIGAGNSYTLYQTEFEVVEIENEDRPKGRLTALFDAAFVQSIMTDYESA